MSNQPLATSRGDSMQWSRSPSQSCQSVVLWPDWACVVAYGIVGGRFGGLGANSPSAKWAIAIGHSVTGDSAVATNVFSLVKHHLPLLLRMASHFFKTLIFLIFWLSTLTLNFDVEHLEVMLPSLHHIIFFSRLPTNS